MNTFLVVLFANLIRLFSVSAERREEGKRSITNGFAAPSHRPFYVAVEMNGIEACGGTIVHEYAVLTAAHCTIKVQSITIIYGDFSSSRGRRHRVKSKRIVNAGAGKNGRKAENSPTDLTLTRINMTLRWL